MASMPVGPKHNYNWDQSIALYYTRWLPGFVRFPNYAPSPSHMHPVNNYHHTKSCHPTVKQYITTHHNKKFIPVIPKSQRLRPRCVYGYILYTGQCPRQDTSLDVSLPLYLLPPTLLPFSTPSLRCSLLPPLASSLPSFLRSVHAYVPSSLVPFLNIPSLPPLPLPPSHTSSLPHALPLLPPSPLSHCSLTPSHPPSCIAPSVPPPLASLPASSGVVFGQLHWVYCVAPSQAWLRDNGGVALAAVTFSVRTPTTNPFLTNIKQKIRRSKRATNTHKHGRRSYLSDGIGGDSKSLLEREPLRSKDSVIFSYNID